MKAVFPKSFGKKIKKQIERYQFEVGVLEDKPHRNAESHGRFEEPKLGYYAGGPVRKATRENSDQSIGDVLISNMERINTNLLLAPFQQKSSEILRFTKAFLELVTKRKMSIKRVENLLQAIVRNPILRGEYGGNRANTADAKGFDRHLIDTAQTFKAIKARAKRV